MRCTIAPGLLGSGLGLFLLGCTGGDLNLPSDGTPIQLTAVSGGGQEARVGSLLPESLVVRVTDQARQPLPNVTVMFRFLEEMPDAEIKPASVATDSSGSGWVRVRLGTATGAHTIVAEATPEAQATFGVTAVERRGGGGGGHGGGEDDDDSGDGENED
jgi:hypothetical protein